MALKVAVVLFLWIVALIGEQQYIVYIIIIYSGIEVSCFDQEPAKRHFPNFLDFIYGIAIRLKNYCHNAVLIPANDLLWDSP